ncbi:hypothetical protein BDY19DRAFT_991928 [Irpex rosettiformis]|uniref:Uncharacterized protein n=1 Tax=Irpex rosettiformis TaxID=378272 RepID=A0ACB8UAV0_9APHY|nr:hypothetical protein BDY19DRAFT_991928 [Irpex rosettiformis]
MAGANYMGGRRNAMKARARDTDGKLQKNHFGKQRLSVLTKGLGKALNSASNKPSLLSNGPTHSSNQLSEISLAHAWRPSLSSYNNSDGHNQLPTPAYTKVLAPTSSIKPKESGSGTSSSSSSKNVARRSSIILQEMDLTEPFCFRAEVSRLLAHPDFAGLSGTKERSRAIPCRSESSHTSQEEMIYSDTKMTEWTFVASSTSSFGLNEPNIDDQGYAKYNYYRGDIQDSNPDFESMSFDDDSGYAEITPVNISHSSLSGSELGSPDDHSCRPTRDSTPPSRPRLVDSGRQSGLLDKIEARPQHKTTSAFSPNLESLPFRFTTNPSELLDDSLTTSPRTMASTNYRRESSFLERMVAKYPHVSASVQSDRPSSCFSPSRYESPPRLCSPSCDTGYSSKTAPDTVSKQQSPPEEEEEAVETILLDVVEGKLFEGSNPWKAIKERLSRSPSVPGVVEGSISDNKELFIELQTTADRRGVGFPDSQPRHSAFDNLAASSVRDDEVLTASRTFQLPSYSSNRSQDSEEGTHHVELNQPSPQLSPSNFESQESLSFSAHWTLAQEDTDRSNALDMLILPATCVSTKSSDFPRTSASCSPMLQSFSPTRDYGNPYVRSTSQVGQEPACLQTIIPTIRKYPLMAHSSPPGVCMGAISGVASASAVLPDNASAGDVEEVERAHRQEDFTVPIQPSPKERLVAGPLLFDDELEDSDDM